MSRLREIWILYRRELTGALRERSIVVNSILLPIFLYPAFLWLAFSAITFVEGLSEGLDTRIALIELPAEHRAIRDSLIARESVEFRTVDSVARAIDGVRAGDLDAAAVFLPPDDSAAAVVGNFRVRLIYDRSEERSRRARSRIEGVIDGYRERWLARVAGDLGVSPAELEGFRIERKDVATERQRGARFLSEMIPLFLIIMVGLGCFVPSIDTTAGERERSTWETLMTVSASRTSVVTAKYLYVATLGTVAGILNVSALLVTLGAVLQPLLGSEAEALRFGIPLTAVLVMIGGAIGLALFFAAAMMILASFARTFKEGQAMVTPVYWLALVPLVLGGGEEIQLTPLLALIPIVNVAVMVRTAINGVFQWALIAETLLAELVLVAVCLWIARSILQFEDYLLGSYDGSFWRLARERLLGSRGRESADSGEAGGNG